MADAIMKKRWENLRLARVIQWTNGAVAWITVCVVYRIALPIWRNTRRLFGNRM